MGPHGHHLDLRHQALEAPPLSATLMATLTSRAPCVLAGGPGPLCVCSTQSPEPSLAYGARAWSAKVPGEHRKACACLRGEVGRGPCPLPCGVGNACWEALRGSQTAAILLGTLPRDVPAGFWGIFASVKGWGTWVAQSVKHLPSAQVTIPGSPSQAP